MSAYSRAGISFKLPDDWKEAPSWHESNDQEWLWKAPMDRQSEAAVIVGCINEEINPSDIEKFKEGGVQALADEEHDWMEDADDYEILDRGSIEIDGADCYYVEYSDHFEIDNEIWDYVYYDLYIPVTGGQQVAKLSFEYETGSGSAGKDDYKKSELIEQDRKLRDEVISSIRID